MFFHGARFSNYEAWVMDPTHIKPSAQVVWPVVGQEILNGDVGGGFQVSKLPLDSSRFGVPRVSLANFNYTVQLLLDLSWQLYFSLLVGSITTKQLRN